MDGVRIDKPTFNKGLKISDLLNKCVDGEWDPETNIESFKDRCFEQISSIQKLTNAEKTFCVRQCFIY